ncbi:helix-turn-helix domain-containing protein [Paenibacillus allorhizosphaerae]|uniref:Arabinose operon regulatory protein n=1 Tax=Paenibacillus allorhizosphaerae TaxID=2849866 RepID=A0ABM8VIB2_9BACL|nr:AraC family transcriptional regulator [Paenibacillus allorhizosphaerae]CAG7642901.1 Arabinose operon regulatory protein [Paenibacillus allorhizosphaerae]
MTQTEPNRPPKKPYLLEHASRSGSFNMPQNHAHDSYEIYYLKAGSRYYFIKDRSYLVREGELVLIEPMVLHKTTEAYSPHHERVLINFKPSWLSQMLAELDVDALSAFGVSPVIRPEGRDQAHVQQLIAAMLTEQDNKEPGSEGCIKLLMTELLLWLYRYVSKQSAEQGWERADHPTTLHRKVSDMVKHINEHYPEPLSLKGISEHFHISPYYLCRIFKEATGFTLIEYIQRLRVHEAQKLLQSTQLPVSGVAEQVGFDSGTHFGRVFKSVSGMSPLQYRKTFGT